MTILLSISGLLIIIATLVFLYIYKRHIHVWLPSYGLELVSPRESIHENDLIHIMFCLVDHFEPGTKKADSNTQDLRVEGWVHRYPQMAGNFIDADGFHPRHTWFYPPHYYKKEHISELIKLSRDGFGEIEMHLHHSRMEPFPDTSETLKKKILDCIELYSQFGIFKTRVAGKPVIRYAFIHGDWALDNSREEHCGVNDELTILMETGCYSDLTFPSYMWKTQPKKINSLYYTKDDPLLPKSYDTGRDVCIGSVQEADELLMIQGPLGFRWKGRNKRLVPSVEDGELSSVSPPSKERVDYWINKGIHIKGRPNWIVVKLHTHGAPISEHDALLGNPIQEMHNYLQLKYNRGVYRLHYVAARELYNIIKAAEVGETGNPGEYRNYIIDKYDYI